MVCLSIVILTVLYFDLLPSQIAIRVWHLPAFFLVFQQPTSPRSALFSSNPIFSFLLFSSSLRLPSSSSEYVICRPFFYIFRQPASSQFSTFSFLSIYFTYFLSSWGTSSLLSFSIYFCFFLLLVAEIYTPTTTMR